MHEEKPKQQWGGETITLFATLPETGGVKFDRDGGKIVLLFAPDSAPAAFLLSQLGRDCAMEITIKEAAL